MQGVIEFNDANVKNEIRNNENGIVKELVIREHQLFALPVIKKELNDVSQCIEIKKEVDDRDVTMELVSIKQEVGVKQENIQMDLLKTISLKEEVNKINELVRVCKSEEVLNREGIITNFTGIQNEILKPIKIKNEHVNLVEGLFNEYNVDNKSELVKFINVKNENNFTEDLVSEYHESKAVTNKKEAERKENKHEDVRKENRQVDDSEPIIIDLRKEMLICAVNGNQCVQNTNASVAKSILTPKTFSYVHPDNMKNRIIQEKQTHPDNLRNRIIQDKQIIIGNNVEENNVKRDVVKIKLNVILGEEIEKQLLGEIDVQRSETELVKPIEIDSILRKSVLAFGSSCVETPNSAAVGLPMVTEEKRSCVSSDQTNKVAEPIKCITLLDDDDDLLTEMDDLSAKKTTTSSAMDIEFVDCSQEDDAKKNTGDASFAALQPIGTSSQLEYKEQIMAHMDRSVTAVDCSPIYIVHRCPPPVSSSQCVQSDKPPISYVNLIRLAITTSPINKMTFSEIYHFIIEMYPYYRSAHVGWKKMISRTLSQNKWFMRVSGPSSSPGKLCYWTMDYKYYKGLPGRR